MMSRDPLKPFYADRVVRDCFLATVQSAAVNGVSEEL